MSACGRAGQGIGTIVGLLAASVTLTACSTEILVMERDSGQGEGPAIDGAPFDGRTREAGAFDTGSEARMIRDVAIDTSHPIESGRDVENDSATDTSIDSGSDSGLPAANMLLWLKADAIAGLTTGSAVSTWKDSSGKSRDATQPSAAAQPTYVAAAKSSLPVVHFTASAGTYLTTPPFQLFATGSSPLTIFIVFRATSVGVQSFLVQQPQSGCGGSNFEFGYHTGDGTYPNMGLHGGCSAADVTSSSIAAATWYVAVLQILATGTSPANVEIRWNGADQTVVQNSGGWVSAGSYGTLSNSVNIGIRDDRISSGAYNGPFDGDIGEIVVYSEVDSTLETAVEALLRSKWGI